MTITNICKEQLFVSFKMLNNLIDQTPPEIWDKKAGGYIYWQQIVHALTGSLFWLRTSDEGFKEPYAELNIYPELEKDAENDLSKEQLKDLLQDVEKLAVQLFNELDDQRLTEKSFVYNKTTNLHVIIGQIRHLQYHIGHCESILREEGVTAIEWLDDYGS